MDVYQFYTSAELANWTSIGVIELTEMTWKLGGRLCATYVVDEADYVWDTILNKYNLPFTKIFCCENMKNNDIFFNNTMFICVNFV